MLKRSDLHGYQEKAVDFVKTKMTVNLWLGLSLGKTISSLTAIQELYDNFQINKILILAPLRVCQTVWRQEALNWEHTEHLTFKLFAGAKAKREAEMKRDAAITLCNYENIQALVKYHKDNKLPWDYDMVVFDESTKMKNSMSKRFRAIRPLLKKSPYRINLTGTPSPNGLMDLYGQTWCLDGGARLGWNLSAFRRSFFNSDYFGYTFTPKDGAMHTIQSKLADITLSMSTDDYLDLPPMIFDIIQTPLEGKLMRQYLEFEKEALLAIGDEEISAVNAAVLTGRLRQFSSGMIYGEDDKPNIPLHTLKLDMLDDIFADNPDEDFIVVYEFKHELERLMKRYPDGEVINDLNIERWNKGEIRKLFLQPQSASHGINLQYNKKGNTMIFMTTPWSLELYQQTIGRLYRQNATETVKVSHLIVGDVDLKVARALTKKDATQQELLVALKR